MPLVNRDAIASVLTIVDNPKAKDAKPDQFFDNSLLQSLVKS